MDNVLNRPMFRRREARDRLNDMAGVQGYQDGGLVRGVIPSMVTGPGGELLRGNRQPSIMPPGPVPSPAQELSFETVTLNPGTTMAQVFLYDRNTGQVRLPDGSRLPAAAEANISQALQQQEMVSSGAGIGALLREEDRLRGAASSMFGQGQGAIGVELAEQAGELRPRIEEEMAGYEEISGRPIPPSVSPRGLTALEGPESISPETLDIFNELGRAAPAALPEVVAEDAPAPRLAAPTGPTGFGARPEGPAAGMPAAPKAEVPSGPSGMEMEARGRGPMLATTPAEVATGLNSEDPAVRDKTLADFMAEFTANAPKYEGVDKNLLLAQIGFAIAAGESPNAMQNIANGLLAGSEMMIKDKAAKDEFDRQLQLSAMQYGLQEVSKEREAARNGSFFVAAEPVTIGGRKYSPGETVFVSNATIAKEGVPPGLTTEAMADAVARNRAALEKALVEAEASKKISVSEFNSLNEQLNLAAESFESNRALRPLVEASLVRAADGSVTGVSSFFIEMTNKAANAVGVDLGRAYEDPEKYQKDMLKVGNRLVQEILRESGRTVSNVDRELVAQMVGQINNIQAQVTTDPDILVGTLQDILQVIDQNERAALDQYRTITEATAGLYAPSGAPLELSARATRVFGETAPIDMEELFSYDEATGVWKPKVR